GCYGPWLDGRNDGGYIVVPPSEIAHGGREGVYAWLDGHHPLECQVATMPAWLLQHAKTTKRTTKLATPDGAAIAGIAGQGRNNALTSLAGTMRRRDASEQAVRQALLAENASFPEPLPVEEIDGIVASAMRNFATADVEDLDARYTDKANAERLAHAS